MNQNPAGNTYGAKWGIFRKGTRNVDIGAGKFEKATEFLRGLGVENIPYDPINRDAETNARAAEEVRKAPADTATVHNVLNVIDSDAAMENVINQAARAIKQGGTAIFTVYEGDKSGKGKATRAGYQRNERASAYVPAIKKYFGNVEAHGNVILAKQPKDVGPAFWAFDSKFEDGARFSIGGLYTGSAADYDKPSLHYVGTGEGSQVYGWGLYGSTVRGVAEGYAEAGLQKKHEITHNGKAIQRKANPSTAKELAEAEMISAGDVKSVASSLAYTANFKKGKEKALYRAAAKYAADHAGEYKQAGGAHLYEQTFFTDRAPGDESRLLKWYEPVTKEQLGWIEKGLQTSDFGLPDGAAEKLKSEVLSPKSSISGGELYKAVSRILGSPKAASEFLARAGIDGIKYPVDSYGKTVKDGDKAGWNYVSFRDDNIRVDHKWTDGEMRFSRPLFTGRGTRVVDGGTTGEQEPGIIAASAELSNPNGSPLAAFGGKRRLALPVSELEWLRKKVTGDLGDAIVGRKSSARGKRLAIDADVFGLVDRTDLEKIKGGLKDEGLFLHEDIDWLAGATGDEIREMKRESENALADRLKTLADDRVAGRAQGGHGASGSPGGR